MSSLSVQASAMGAAGLGAKAHAGAERAADFRDSAFGFALFVPALFLSQIGTAGALLFTAVTLVYASLRARELGGIFAPCALLLTIPAFLVLSTLWSEAPSDTLKYGLEFALTVATGLLFSAARARAALWGALLAFGVYILVTFMFGQFVPLGADGETAFSGLSDSKNLLADIAVTGLLVAAFNVFAGIEGRRWFRSIVAIGVALLLFYALLQARSAGAMLGLALGGAVFLGLLVLRSVGVALRVATTMFLAVCAAVGAVFYQTLSAALIDAGTRFFDKDTTLTGRTYLWQRAYDLIAEKPVLGKGFGAFWQQGNPDAEGMWRYAGIADRQGFDFHNTFIEILVHLGWAGLILISAAVLIGAMLLLARTIVQPTLSRCFWLSLVVYELSRTPIETIAFNQFYFSTVLLFAALGSALVRPRAPRERSQARIFRPIRRRDGGAWLKSRLRGDQALGRLEQFQEKCDAVFRPELRPNKELERFIDSVKR